MNGAWAVTPLQRGFARVCTGGRVADALCVCASLSFLALPRLAVKLNGNRKVTGTLRGFDQFLNIVLDEAVDLATKESMGMIVVRGNSVLLLEPLERLG